MNISSFAPQIARSNQPAPAPQPQQHPMGDVEYSYNPQDQLVMEPGTFTVSGVAADGSTGLFQTEPTMKAAGGKYVLEKNLVDRILVSKITASGYSGDAYFPKINEEWAWRWMEGFSDFRLYDYRKIEAIREDLRMDIKNAEGRRVGRNGSKR